MNERENQISFAMSMIQELCENYDISLLPCMLADETISIIVVDNISGEQYILEDYFNACIDSENVFIELSSSEKDVARIKKAIKDKPSKNKKTIENRNKRLNDAKSNLSSISSRYLAVLRERKEI